MVKGLDISHYQNDKGPIDWAKVKAAGYEFVYIKATEELSWKDKYYALNVPGARAVGLLIGSYHFARAKDAVGEADWFLSVVGQMQRYDFLVLDWEIEFSDPVGWCLKFLNRCREKTGVTGLFYTNEERVVRINWTPLVEAGYPLIVAKYGDNDEILEPNEIAKDDEWPIAAIQQYSSRASVPGIIGFVDVNQSNISLEELKKYGYQSNNQPTPMPKQLYFRYGHAKDLFVKVGDKVKKGQKIGTIGKGGPNNFSAHVHFDILKNKVASWTAFVINKSKEWVAENYENPEPWKKIVLPNFSHEGLDFLEPWKYPAGPAFHPGDDLNSGAGDSDLGHPFYSACDGVVLYAYNEEGSNNGWGKLLVIEETINQPNPEPPMEGKCKVEPELREALKQCHGLDFGEYIDPQDQRLLAERDIALKKSEMASREKLEEIKKILG